MSLSGECASCPLSRGFNIEGKSLMHVCVTPSQRCVDLRNKLPDQIAAWNRLAGIAEHTKAGVLDFGLLYQGDILRIEAGTPDVSLNSHVARSLLMKVDEVVESKLHCTVLHDSYSEEEDFERRLHAIEGRHEIVIAGAFERTGVNDDDSWRGVEIPGELHVGRYMTWRPEDAGYRHGSYVQEISLVSADSAVAMPLFGTDRAMHRAAPPLDQG